MSEYSKINWKDYPNISTPLMASNLNHMDGEIYDLRNNSDTNTSDISQLKVQKVNQEDFLNTVQSVTFNPNTGVFTIAYQTGQIVEYDTGLNKIAVNFRYDDDPTSPHYGSLVITLDDGTYQYVDLTKLIQTINFIDSERIKHTQDGNAYQFDLKKGSITGEYLETNYLANVISYTTRAEAAVTTATQKADDATAASITSAQKAEESYESSVSAAISANIAEQKATEAATSATNALISASSASASATTASDEALKSEGYAVGTQNGTAVGPDSPYYQNNSKYYSEQFGEELDEFKEEVYKKNEVDNLVDAKQDKLTEGKNITINNNVISSKTSASIIGERLVFS